jgi:lipid II:glycine glycyltransferase (peptidoglycan interpeptide bridge formation enzyme)
MAFFEWLRNYSSRIGALGIKGAFSHTSPSTDDAVSEMLTGLGYRVTTHATFLVDLQVAQNELWEGVDRSVRKNVRKCEKSAASVHLIRHADEFRHLFYATYRESENQAGRHCVPFSSFAPLMGPLLRPQYDFFVACSDDGVPLATLGVYYHDGTATEMASTLTQFALKEKIPAQDLLHWEVLKHAKSRGMHTFDLAGVNPNPVSPKEVGILRFKGKWGGTSRQFLTYTYDGSSQFARLFRMLKNAVRRVSGSHR